MKLGNNFTLDKYGLHLRFVNEDDAEFILNLRTDERLGRFIHYTENDLEKEKRWISDYKIREKNGTEYYFIYYYKGEPIGVNRIYDIKEDHATGGSWVCKTGLPMELPILMLIILREIIFEMLNLSYEKFDVRKKNHKVLRVNELFGADKIKETDLDYFYELSSETFKQKKSYFLNLLNVNKLN
ncbi:GNAT family N-acetyltransferase [Bacteroides sedimenti]|uniref:N-acetyltransferase domain-containing protein n=1 Tax=Bacteroides sedimenti TaxID=2136147 RepID=A0ABM8ICH2_9BACE